MNKKSISINEVTHASKGLITLLSIFVLLFAFIVQTNIELPSFLLILIFGLAFMGLLVGSLSMPDLPLYALTAYLPFSKILVGDFGGYATALNLTNMLTIGALCVWAMNSLTSGRKFYTRTSLDIPLLIFMLLACLSLIKGMSYFGSNYVIAYIFPLKRLLTPMSLFFIFFNMIKSKAGIKNITIIIMCVMTVVALMAIKDYIDIGQSSSLDKSRVEGITLQPNILAAFFVYYMFLFAGFMLVYWRNIKYWLLLLPFLACFRGIQVTFSRGGYLAFAAAVMAIALFKNKVLFAALILVMLFSILNPAVLPKGIQYRLLSTFKNDTAFSTDIEEIADRSSLNRIEAWKGAIEMIKEEPFVGKGYGIFPYLIPHYAPVYRMDAHNEYLLIAAEMGLPALFMFLLVLTIIFFKTRKLYLTTKDPFMKALALGFLGGLGGVFVANIFGGRLDSQEMSSYFWILAALVFKALYIEKKENENAPVHSHR